MSKHHHHYLVRLAWTGNTGNGTADHQSYSRLHEIVASGRPKILGSTQSIRGDNTRWNPQLMLVGSIAACHQLWYLNICAANGVVVTAYEDQADGVMEEMQTGGGQFRKIVLKPFATLASGSDVELATSLHDEAAAKCFITRSVNFPIIVQPEFAFQGENSFA